MNTNYGENEIGLSRWWNPTLIFITTHIAKVIWVNAEAKITTFLYFEK